MTIGEVHAAFPNLRHGSSITSPCVPDYNCIGWAANDDTHFWWPDGISYWPIAHNSAATTETFEEAFRTIGYSLTGLNESLDLEVEKVAIYVRPATGAVTHMARQLDNGRWTSKLGQRWDIEHFTPQCLNGATYGEYRYCLGRLKSASTPTDPGPSR